MISPEDAAALKEKFAVMKKDVRIQYYVTSNCELCDTVKQLIEELNKLAGGKLKLEVKDITEAPEPYKSLGSAGGVIEHEGHTHNVNRGPIIILGDNEEVVYLGSPVGHEGWAFVETLVMLSTEDPKLTSEQKDKLLSGVSELNGRYRIETVVTPTCPYCPFAVLMANQLAIATGGKLQAECVNAWEYPEIAEKYNVQAVPMTFVGSEPHNGKLVLEGALRDMNAYISRILSGLSE